MVSRSRSLLKQPSCHLGSYDAFSPSDDSSSAAAAAAESRFGRTRSAGHYTNRPNFAAPKGEEGGKWLEGHTGTPGNKSVEAVKLDFESLKRP